MIDLGDKLQEGFINSHFNSDEKLESGASVTPDPVVSHRTTGSHGATAGKGHEVPHVGSNEKLGSVTPVTAGPKNIEAEAVWDGFNKTARDSPCPDDAPAQRLPGPGGYDAVQMGMPLDEADLPTSMLDSGDKLQEGFINSHSDSKPDCFNKTARSPCPDDAPAQRPPGPGGYDAAQMGMPLDETDLPTRMIDSGDKLQEGFISSPPQHGKLGSGTPVNSWRARFEAGQLRHATRADLSCFAAGAAAWRQEAHKPAN